MGLLARLRATAPEGSVDAVQPPMRIGADSTRADGPGDPSYEERNSCPRRSRLWLRRVQASDLYEDLLELLVVVVFFQRALLSS